MCIPPAFRMGEMYSVPPEYDSSQEGGSVCADPPTSDEATVVAEELSRVSQIETSISLRD